MFNLRHSYLGPAQYAHWPTKDPHSSHRKTRAVLIRAACCVFVPSVARYRLAQCSTSDTHILALPSMQFTQERPSQLSPQNARCSNSRCLLRFCTLSRPVERRDTLLSPAQWLHPPSTDPRNFTPKHALLRDAHCVFFASTPAQYRSAQFSPPDTQFLYSLPDPNTRPVQTRATSPPNTLFFFALRIVTSLRPQPSNTDSHNSRLQTLASSLSPTRY